jgi:2-hydroxychromene-2-carboxylate isomerase
MSHVIGYDFAPVSPRACLGHAPFRAIALHDGDEAAMRLSGEIFCGQDRLDFLREALAA